MLCNEDARRGQSEDVYFFREKNTEGGGVGGVGFMYLGRLVKTLKDPLCFGYLVPGGTGQASRCTRYLIAIWSPGAPGAPGGHPHRA